MTPIVKRLKGMLPFGAAMLAAFYLLPLLILNTGSGMLVLLILVPALCFACALAYGWRRGFDWLYFVLVMLLFFPSLFLFYNSSAWVYIPAYGIIALAGSGLGGLIHRYLK